MNRFFEIGNVSLDFIREILTFCHNGCTIGFWIGMTFAQKYDNFK